MLPTGNRAPKNRRKTPAWIKRPGKFLSDSGLLTALASRLGVWYLKLVFHTNAWTVEPADALDIAKPHLPVIATVWHGQHVLLPVIPIGLKASVMISRSIDGEITARIAQAFGAKPIRASGGRERGKALQKGGIKGFLDMLAALERGENVLQTADVPKGTPRKAGSGVIQLAKHSGRPIIPLAVASSRRWILKRAWDRTTVNLPFGRSAICMGEPIYVPGDANDQELEILRGRLETEMNRITARAYELGGNPE
ncbi:MAG: lysophospholipid acyltransferase family protein [Rhizobiaceae bacterium]